MDMCQANPLHVQPSRLEVLTERKELLEMINKEQTLQQTIPRNIFSTPTYDSNSAFHLECLCSYDRMKNSKKSLDSVNTSAFMLKQLPDEYLNTITVLFNKCAEGDEFSQSGELAKGIFPLRTEHVRPRTNFALSPYYETQQKYMNVSSQRELSNGTETRAFTSMSNQVLQREGDYKPGQFRRSQISD